jgi:hypothetical protein
VPENRVLRRPLALMSGTVDRHGHRLRHSGTSDMGLEPEVPPIRVSPVPLRECRSSDPASIHTRKRDARRHVSRRLILALLNTSRTGIRRRHTVVDPRHNVLSRRR